MRKSEEARVELVSLGEVRTTVNGLKKEIESLINRNKVTTYIL